MLVLVFSPPTVGTTAGRRAVVTGSGRTLASLCRARPAAKMETTPHPAHEEMPR